MNNITKTKKARTIRGIAVGLMTAVFIPALALAASSTNKGATPSGKPFIEIQGQIIEVEGEISTLQDQVDSLVDRVDTIEDRVMANEDAIAGLEAQNLSLQSQIDANGSDIDSIEGEIGTLYGAIANLQSQIDDLGDFDGTLQAQIDTNEANITTLAQTVDTLGGDLQAQIDNNLSLIGALQDEVDMINAELALKQARVTGSCASGYAITSVNINGGVTCAPLGTGSSALTTYYIFTYANPNGYRYSPGFPGLIAPGRYGYIFANCASGYRSVNQSLWFTIGWSKYGEQTINTSSIGLSRNDNSYSTYYYAYVSCAKTQ